MKIIFVRHGESKHNAKISEEENTGLTPNGRKQTEHLAKELKKQNISVIYTSKLKRSIETAEIISKVLGVPIKENLEELDEYSGSQFKSKLRFLNFKFTKRLKKLRRFLDKLSKERETDKTILIVAHGITNRIILGHLLELPMKKQLLRFIQNNTCINILFWNQHFNNWDVKCFNNLEHLPIKLRQNNPLR